MQACSAKGRPPQSPLSQELWEQCERSMHTLVCAHHALQFLLWAAITVIK